MLNGYRFRLYASPTQAQVLLRWIDERLIYNAKVQEDRFDQRYSQFITDQTPFLRQASSQVLPNEAVRWRQAYQRFFKNLSSRPKITRKSGRQSVSLTAALFQFLPVVNDTTGEMPGYQLHVVTDQFPVGAIPYVAHRPYAVPASIYIAVEGGQWRLSFAAEDADVSIPGCDADAVAELIAADWRPLSADQLAERMLGGDRGIAKSLMTSNGQSFGLWPVQKKRIQQAHRQPRASRRKKGSQNEKKAYYKAARYHQCEKHVGHEYAHQTRHALVVNEAYDRYVFEDLPIQQMTRCPQAQRNAHGHCLPNGPSGESGAQSRDARISLGTGGHVHPL
jgi:putative transposase